LDRGRGAGGRGERRPVVLWHSLVQPLLINDTVIATQILEFNDPGHFFDVEYKIPEKLTRSQNTVRVTFQAYPRKTAGGLYGCQTLTRQAVR
jgi:hypothetical protein